MTTEVLYTGVVAQYNCGADDGSFCSAIDALRAAAYAEGTFTEGGEEQREVLRDLAKIARIAAARSRNEETEWRRAQ